MITIGSDPELFLFDPARKQYKSSVGLIGGSKQHPLPMDEPGFFVQEDNVTVEFNTKPAVDMEEFVRGIDYSLSYIGAHATKLGLSVRLDAAAYFSPEELSSPEAMTFGCEPDYNAWTKKINPRPATTDQQLRSCGGHVHVGGAELNPWEIVRMMDLFLGVPSVIMDTDTLRKSLYGKAGACRIKPYGPEYRVLSNFWLKSKELNRWVYSQTLRAVQAVRNKMDIREEAKAIQAAINTADVNLAGMLSARHNLALV